MTTHGLSIDLEDWHQLVAIRAGQVPGEPWRHFDECVDSILSLCDELGCRATFFVLGLLARRRPSLVRKLADAGHEIASHSLAHRLVHTMSRSELTEDLRGSKRMLEDMSGSSVSGFRAPEFSVKSLDSPCFEALAEAGFTYDSSVFPVPSLRYGIPDAPNAPFTIHTSAGPLFELPLATTPIGTTRFPIAGGSHFRLLPTTFVRWAARRAESRAEPLVFYFHPYEFARRPLYVSGGLRANRAIAKLVALHNFNTGQITRTLRRLAVDLRLAPLRELIPASREAA